MLSVQSLFNDKDHYSKCRHSFLPLAKYFTERMPRWCQHVFPGIIKNIILLAEEEKKNGCEKRECHSVCSVLSIGGGSGEVDRMMLQQLQGMFSNIKYSVVEPSLQEIEKFRNLVEGDTHLLKTAFDWHMKTFDEFIECMKVSPRDSFNFIHIIEAIYYMPYDGAIQEMYNILALGGILLIIVTADGSGYHNLWKRHRSILQDDRMNFITSADVKKELRMKNIPFMSIRDESRVDISEVFVDNSDVGDRILDFLTHICNFRQTVPKNIRDDLIQLLKSEQCCETLDGRKMFNNSSDAIIVQKQG
uniref:Histamine N-methyltransferase-like n=1 Tax=Saccoglossus kowalevskii TaxID=10224 RepID=A0ABM0M0G4_SACKO|nr:PREDICTED: histamine N-methyltransferase-like [Saccoglossus kowalevskii]